jgi:multisubunit Na+/H+ antiporter MnhB subunit
LADAHSNNGLIVCKKCDKSSKGILGKLMLVCLLSIVAGVLITLAGAGIENPQIGGTGLIVSGVSFALLVLFFALKAIKWMFKK